MAGLWVDHMNKKAKDAANAALKAALDKVDSHEKLGASIGEALREKLRGRQGSPPLFMEKIEATWPDVPVSNGWGGWPLGGPDGN